VMAAHIYGLHHALSWGKWDNQPAWSLEDLESDTRADLEDDDFKAIESLESGTCPQCGLPLEWGEPVPIEHLEAIEKRSLGAGFYQLADMRSPPVEDKFHPKYPILGYLGNMKHIHLQEAARRAEAEARAEAEEYQGWWDSLLHNN